MDKEDVEEKDEVALLTAEAMIKAKEAFYKFFSDQGYETAFWDIRITVWKKDSTFSQRLERFELEDECE